MLTLGAHFLFDHSWGQNGRTKVSSLLRPESEACLWPCLFPPYLALYDLLPGLA